MLSSCRVVGTFLAQVPVSADTELVGEDVEVDGVRLEVIDPSRGAYCPGLGHEEHVDRLGLQLLSDVAVDLVPAVLVLVLVLQSLVDPRVGLFVAVMADVVAAFAGVVGRRLFPGSPASSR